LNGFDFEKSELRSVRTGRSALYFRKFGKDAGLRAAIGRSRFFFAIIFKKSRVFVNIGQACAV